MPSTAERELGDFMKSLEREDPERLARYWALAGRLYVYPKWAVDSMSQYPTRHRGPVDAFVFTFLWNGICRGEILCVHVHVGTAPYSDVCRQENNAVLANLPEPFTATFVGGHGVDGDGSVEWSAPIKMTESYPSTDVPDKLDGRSVEVEPGSALLEVGSQSAARTWFELLQGGALARWPYGHEWLYLLKPTWAFHKRYSVL
jgi:hypothetical protein